MTSSMIYKQEKKRGNLKGEDVIFISYEDFQNFISLSSLGLIITLATWHCKEENALHRAPSGFQNSTTPARRDPTEE